MALRLRIPVFVGTFTPQGERALRQLRKTLPADLRGFLTNYFSELDEAVTDDSRFDFRLCATLELAPKDREAVAIQFTHLNDMTDAEKEAVEQMGRKGQVIIRNRRQPVSGIGMLSGKAATEAIQEALPYRFNKNHFIATYKRLNARPSRGAPDPDHTNPDCCVYDEPTGWYRYTKAYVKYLVRKCSTPEGFEQATGMKPRPVK